MINYSSYVQNNSFPCSSLFNCISLVHLHLMKSVITQHTRTIWNVPLSIADHEIMTLGILASHGRLTLTAEAMFPC